MGKIKQSLAWWCFANKVTPDDLIAAAARIGYAGVEMCPQELWPKVRDAGLRIVSTGGHRSLTDGLNRRENHDRIEREIQANLELAQRWDIPVLIVFSGNRNGLDDLKGIEITAEGLRRVARAAEEAGVTLALELLNSRVDHPDYQCDRTAWGVAVCQAVNSPRVKLLYDIYHMQIMEGDVIRTIRDNIAYIGHFHTAGNPGRNELGEAQELYYPAIMRAIAATDYEGYVGQEFMPTGDPLAALEHAYKVCGV
ncbi:MAG TPA: TIM barrel protein [Chthonomonadaceae bacterium]|nr:TIM barrel protein [Chthonomonadaceae bacterium]